METLFISKDAILSQKENTLRVKTAERQMQVPLSGVKHIILLSEGTLTTKLLGLFGSQGVRVSVFDHYGWLKGCFEPIEHLSSAEVRLKQAQLILDPDRRLEYARLLLEASCANMRGSLAYHFSKGNTALKPCLDKLDQAQAGLQRATSIPMLMGEEGRFKRLFYEAWPVIDERLAFGNRIKRPPNNRINCLLSFINGLVYATVRHEIAKTHLDEGFSVLHAPSGSRSSLSLDFAEPFKPILTDRLIWRMVRKGEIQDHWFEESLQGVCMLSETGRKAVALIFAERLEENYLKGSLRESMRRMALDFERSLWTKEVFLAYRYRS